MREHRKQSHEPQSVFGCSHTLKGVCRTGCAECGETFPESEMIPFARSWICAKCKPIYLQRLREGAPLAPFGAEAWQSGDEVVIRNGGTLPGRCIKCNGAAMGLPIKSRFFWHPDRMLVLLLIPPVYLFAFLSVAKRVKLSLPVCETHFQQRRAFVGLSWLLVGTGIATTLVATYFGSEMLQLLALLITVVAIVPAFCEGMLVSVKTIDGEYVRLRGLCEEYRAALPEFPEGR